MNAGVKNLWVDRKSTPANKGFVLHVSEVSMHDFELCADKFARERLNRAIGELLIRANFKVLSDFLNGFVSIINPLLLCLCV